MWKIITYLLIGLFLLSNNLIAQDQTEIILQNNQFLIASPEQFADAMAIRLSYEKDKNNTVLIPVGWKFNKTTRKFMDFDCFPPIQEFTISSTPNTDRINLFNAVQYRIRQYDIKIAGKPRLLSDNWRGSGVGIHPLLANRDDDKLKAKIRNRLKLKPAQAGVIEK